MSACPNCQGTDLRWHLGKENRSAVLDGQLRMHDVSIVAFLACEECSETITIAQRDAVETMLNGYHILRQEVDEWTEWSNTLATILPEDAETWPGVNPDGAQESIVEAALRHLVGVWENSRTIDHVPECDGKHPWNIPCPPS